MWSPSDNVLVNQNVAADTRLKNVNAMAQVQAGVGRGSAALGNYLRQNTQGGKQMQQNALTQSNAQAKVAKIQGLQAEAQVIAPLLAQVEQSQDPASAYAQAVRSAEAAGIDIAPEFEQYSPDKFQHLKSIYTMPAEELTEFEGLIQGMSPEARAEAIAVRLGLAPSADAQLRGQEGLTSLQQRALDAGLTPGTEPYKQFMLDGGRQKTSKIVYGQDGNPIVYEGAADGAPKPLREFEAKAVQFNARMNEALPRVEVAEKAIEKKGGVSIWDRAASSEVGKMFGGNFLTSSEFQTYQAAAREWIAGLLRLDSGAAVPESEFVRYFQTFFYDAGDNEQTRANKRAAREATMRALQQIVPPDRSAVPSASTGAKPVSEMTLEELEAEAAGQ